MAYDTSAGAVRSLYFAPSESMLNVGSTALHWSGIPNIRCLSSTKRFASRSQARTRSSKVRKRVPSRKRHGKILESVHTVLLFTRCVAAIRDHPASTTDAFRHPRWEISVTGRVLWPCDRDIEALNLSIYLRSSAVPSRIGDSLHFVVTDKVTVLLYA